MGGRRIDGVSSYPASEADLELFERAEEILRQQPRPRFLAASNPSRRMFFANFDGSGQDMERPGSILTNIGALHQDLRQLARSADGRVATEYVAGPGTQSNWATRTVDLAFGFTADDRVVEMYHRLARQSQLWLDANPGADITLAATGYSRGAISSVMFTRLVDRYGILDPEGLRFGRDAHGDLRVESDRPPLVPAGRTAQALYLLDPVSTGIDRDFDLRAPPSVITGASFWARHERRSPTFAHRAVIDLGLSDDGRFAGVLVPGAHGNVGGGNRLNGLELRTGNLLRQAINGLADSPLVPERPLPGDPSLDVIHRSHQGLFGAFEIGSTRAGGERSRREDLCVVVDPCRDAEPRDEALASRYFDRTPARRVGNDVAPAGLDDAGHAGNAMYRAARDGIAAIDRGYGNADGPGSDRAAAALAAAARDAGLERIDHVILGHDRQRLFAVDTADLHSALRRVAHVDVAAARSQPLEVSTRQFDAAWARQADTAARTQHTMERQELRAHALVP